MLSALIQSVINDFPEDIITTDMAEQAIEQMSVQERYQRIRLEAPFNMVDNSLSTVMEHLA